MNLEIRPLLKNVKIVPKTCPECHSFFIENKKCDDCGFDLNTRIVLGPSDEKSFYNLLDDLYYERRRFSISGIPLFPDKYFTPYKKFIRKIEWRLKDILEFLNQNSRLSKTEYFLLKKEALDIIKEGKIELDKKYFTHRTKEIFDFKLTKPKKRYGLLIFAIFCGTLGFIPLKNLIVLLAQTF